MNAFDLHQTIDYFGHCGMILTPEEKTKLQTSFTILKNDMKFGKIHFWGKIIGTLGDYYVSQGYVHGCRNEMLEKTTLYSQDCLNWVLMPQITEEMEIAAKFPITARFTGDPANEANSADEDTDGYSRFENEEEGPIIVKEEDRLATTVKSIDEDVGIVPRGSYTRNDDGEIMTNRFFSGLSVNESIDLNNYYHFREAQRLPYKPIRYLASLDKSIDFLDPISDDIPKGSWSIILERGQSLVHVKSLLWPGYVLYTVPETTKYGSLYFGTGLKNIDLPFML